jgi:dissimilatory sulfite reductase (desulfoviridin) alpha/beta subunit
MGFNTTVVVHNDSLDVIAKDPNFGEKLAKAIICLDYKGDKINSVSASNGNCTHCNAVEVIETHHADQVIAVAVGGNYGVEIGYAGGWQAMGNEADKKVEMIRTLADSLGYTLRKKPQKKN